MTKTELIEKIKEKLDLIPIFFSQEKENIVEKCKYYDEKKLLEILQEIENIYLKVLNDKDKINKKMEQINKEIDIFVQTKNQELTKIIIKRAEEKEKNEDIDQLLNF